MLQRLYAACGALAAVFLILMLLVILAQILTRWAGITFPGAPDYAGYFMAASSFFALAYALEHRTHIRVHLLLSRLEGRARWWLELWCLVIGTGLSWYFAWYAVRAVRISWQIGDVSQGQDATPLWIPQLAMAVGTVVLALAFLDHLLRVWRGGIAAVAEVERTE